MARLIFVNRFYWPDETATGQLLTDLAEALAARGHDVTVVTSRPRQLPGDFSPDRNGVRIAHVGSTRADRGRLFGKMIDFATFYAGTLRQLLQQTRPGTLVVAMTDPPLIGIGAWLVAALRRARLVHWVQDIYPELAMSLTGHSWLRLLRPARNVSWRRAAACVTLGEDMAARLAAAGVRSDQRAVIPNWAPHGVYPPAVSDAWAMRAAWGLADKFIVAYSGNLGRVHDLDAVLELATALRERPDIALAIIGGGAQRERLKATAAARGLSNVHFLPAQPRAQLSASLAAADLHLVTLKPGCEDLVFPSKLYGIVAVGRPVIFVGPPECDVARCITQNGFGVVASRDELSVLATAIQRLSSDANERSQLAEAAARFADDHTLAAAMNRWVELIAQVEGSQRLEKSSTPFAQT